MTDLTRNRIFMIEETLKYIKARADRSDFDFNSVWYGLDLNIRDPKFVLEHCNPIVIEKN